MVKKKPRRRFAFVSIALNRRVFLLLFHGLPPIYPFRFLWDAIKDWKRDHLESSKETATTEDTPQKEESKNIKTQVSLEKSLYPANMAKGIEQSFTIWRPAVSVLRYTWN